MTYYEYLALLTVVAASALDIVTRALQKKRDQAWAIATIGSWTGTLILLPFSINSLGGLIITPAVVGLFLLSGLLWTLMVYWDFKSMMYADASFNLLLTSFRTIFLALAGWWLFEEVLTQADLLGTLAIFGGVFVASPPSVFRKPRGALIRLGSVAAGAAAIVLDKVLVGLTDVRIVIFMGYLLPGIFYLFMRPSDWKKELRFESSRRIVLFLLAVALYVFIGPVFVSAFGLGQMSSTFIIGQSRLVLVLLLGALILRETDHMLRRCLGVLLCVLGITLVLTK